MWMRWFCSLLTQYILTIDTKSAAAASTEKMVNIPKASDSQDERQDKEQRDPAQT